MVKWHTAAPFLPQGGRRLALGLGLIGIGKPWGHKDATVPDEDSAQRLLHTAFDLGIRYLDTAPSYGVSEQRLARFLNGLSAGQRDSLVVATKCGEHWDADKAEPFVDHSYDSLARSLETSLERLGSVDFLQLHKTSPEALRSAEVERAFRYAQSLGVRNVGASVSDLRSAELALHTGLFSVVQFPLHTASLQFRDIALRATGSGMLVATNRPFGMGALLYGEQATTAAEAFRFLAAQPFDGVVLTGTKSASHLQANWAAFHEALATVPTLEASPHAG